MSFAHEYHVAMGYSRAHLGSGEHVDQDHALSPALMKVAAERERRRRCSVDGAAPRRRKSEEQYRGLPSSTQSLGVGNQSHGLKAGFFGPPAVSGSAVAVSGGNSAAVGSSTPPSSASKKTEKRRPAVSRRMRRALNDMYLQKCALRVRHERGDSLDLYDPAELRQIFAVSYTSVFNDLHDSQTASTSFAPFLNVTEEEQEQFLSELQPRTTRCTQNARGKQNTNSEHSTGCAETAPYRFAKVSRKAQGVMLSKVESCESSLRKLEGLVSEVALIPNLRTPVEMESSYERMLLHGLAQYYFVHSFTRPQGKKGSGRVTFLSSTPQSWSSAPECSLVDYLLQEKVGASQRI
ncbi:hypothetical protein FVE85_6567 [Porphyridium purpureum]|uniref:R3H-associated N-terminal domain-containing protein n=1 Tax=Porphyridium purpureum TaxID=35688 RepID=A0A5J4Z7B6_PORPP|nr:hypothetical protein FVE85_6567 [Porphyridium purpureum]|eukprot:POR2216..scf295_1